MLNQDIQMCNDYLNAIFQRARVPMEPLDFSPNWQDQPSRYKIYLDVERLPLPTKIPDKLASMAELLTYFQQPYPRSKGLSHEEIATLLQITHGTLNRRLDVNWNRDIHNRTHYTQANFGRGTASGGGMYPTEIFWVSGQSGQLLPGVYHYDNAHHALARLLVGDFTGRVRTALRNHPAAASCDQFFLISLNFWKNAFKYNSFCYHVVTQDIGALLGSLRLLASGFGSDLPFFFWYPDENLNALLGLDTLAESVFAVVAVPGEGSHTLSFENEGHKKLPETLDRSLVNKASFQRSKEIIRFSINDHVHTSALLKDEPRPDEHQAYNASSDEFSASSERIALPAPEMDLLQEDVLDVFKKRRSSFGRFSSSTPLLLSQFSTMLAFASASRSYLSDIKAVDGTPHFTRLVAFVNHVEGLDRGAYAYDWQRHCLYLIEQRDYSLFLQEQYFLQNYNLSEIAALVAIVGRPERMFEIYGNRGYRILNAEIGLVAQNIYMASTALSFNCGAALGFDNIGLNEALHFEGSDQRTALFLLLGNSLKNNAEFFSSLV